MSKSIERPGDSNHITRRYLDSILLETRYLDSMSASTSYTLFGETFDMPIMTAALSHLNTFARPGGMTDLAKGAKNAGTVMWMGMTEAEEAAACHKTGARIIEIIKPYRDRNLIYEKIHQAEEMGFLAVGVDIDFVYDSVGNPKNFHMYPLQELTCGELQDLIRYSRLPFIVKGILSVQDAKKALQAGVSGMVISHHGGSMEYAIPPLAILPQIAETVQGEVPLFVDCEIRSGMDAFKALALGASGVCIGRHLMEAIKEDGAEGVRSYLTLARGQLKKAMTVTGCQTLDEIEGSILHRIPYFE